tara:strand:- start:93 stop:440 length:348 start_codon:yes stop_codon:yes gene_type:complete
MSHTNQPEYFTINSICPHTGDVTNLGIFEDMKAVAFRLRRCYTSCGDEYRIVCHHLSTAAYELEGLEEQEESRTEYKAKEAEKERKLKEYDEWKGQIQQDLELPNIKAEYQTVAA